MINKSTSGTYMVRLLQFARGPWAWLKTGRVQRAERVPNPVLANYRIESRTHHDFDISPPPTPLAKQQLVDLMLSLVRRPKQPIDIGYPTIYSTAVSHVCIRLRCK
jgi:hypothetical protein